MAADPALLVERLTLPLTAEGDYVLEASLVASGRTRDTAVLPMEIAAEPAGPARRRAVPQYLVERLIGRTSLRTDPRGLSFELLNQTRPASLTAVHAINLDGRAITPDRLLAEISSRTLPLPRRLELPVGRPVKLLVDLGEPLRPGHHVLDLDLTIAGVASGRVRLQGFVKPEELRPSDVKRDR